MSPFKPADRLPLEVPSTVDSSLVGSGVSVSVSLLERDVGLASREVLRGDDDLDLVLVSERSRERVLGADRPGWGRSEREVVDCDEDVVGSELGAGVVTSGVVTSEVVASEVVASDVGVAGVTMLTRNRSWVSSLTATDTVTAATAIEPASRYLVAGASAARRPASQPPDPA